MQVNIAYYVLLFHLPAIIFKCSVLFKNVVANIGNPFCCKLIEVVIYEAVDVSRYISCIFYYIDLYLRVKNIDIYMI